MKKLVLPVCLFLFVGLAGTGFRPALAQDASTLKGKSDHDRILALRRGSPAYTRGDIKFMVRVVFADAMNPERWANNWIRKNHIPSLTHLSVVENRNEAESVDFTVLTLSERAKNRVVVISGFQGNAVVRRWMSIDALLAYFRKLTTSQGKVRLFEAGFLGLKGIRMGMDLKNMLDELHARGLMRTKAEPPLSEEERRQNTTLRLTLSRRSRG